MASSSYEMHVANLSEKLSEHKNELVQMCTAGVRTDYCTELLSSLAVDPFTGLLPEEDKGIIINSLLQLYGNQYSDPLLQQRAKEWASVQLQTMTRIPQEFITEHMYLDSVTISQCLAKVVSVTEDGMGVFINLSDPSHLLHILCRLGMMTMKQVDLPKIIVESILAIFEKSKQTDFNFEQPLASKFFDSLSENVQQGKLQLSERASVLLFCIHKNSVKAEVRAMIKNISSVQNITDVNIIRTSVANSYLPLASSTKPDVFQYALSIMTAAWLNSEGHPGCGLLMSYFVSATIKLCEKQKIMLLFPECIQHLAYLFTFFQEYAFAFSANNNAHVQYLIDLALKAIHSENNTPDDLSILLVIFPSVYYQILQAAASGDNSPALNLLRILWENSGKKTKSELVDMATKLCYNDWFHCPEFEK